MRERDKFFTLGLGAAGCALARGCERGWRERRPLPPPAAEREAVAGPGIICFYSPFLTLFVSEIKAGVDRTSAGSGKWPKSLGCEAGAVPAHGNDGEGGSCPGSLRPALGPGAAFLGGRPLVLPVVLY